MVTFTGSSSGTDGGGRNDEESSREMRRNENGIDPAPSQQSSHSHDNSGDHHNIISSSLAGSGMTTTDNDGLRHHPSIYAVPTTDTLGDESSSLRMRPYQQQQQGQSSPIRYRRRGGGQPQTVPSNSSSSGGAGGIKPSTNSTNSRTPLRSGGGESRTHPRAAAAAAAAAPKNSHVSRRSAKPRTKNTTAAAAVAGGQRKRTSPSSNSSNNNNNNNSNNSTTPRDFQYEQDWPTVSVKYVNVANRSAYELNPCPSVELWQQTANRLAKIKKSSSSNNAGRRLSPSLQHLELIQAMQQQVVIRQVDFSPSCGHGADFFGQQQQDETEAARAAAVKGKKPRKQRRDGRYRAIDVKQASLASLPEVAPILSHTKVRLPSRADVGFPRAAEEEIAQKQREILHETQWEEATPRLIALVTSDLLGTAVMDDDDHHHHNSSNEQHDSTRALHMQWNGGGLEGMPFCGKEIIRAVEWNASQWGRRRSQQQRRRQKSSRQVGSVNHDDTEQNNRFRDVLKPNPYSMLAPPLDATYSRSQHWRPRPFHDRPAGRVYALACPTQVEFAGVGSDLEPLVGSLTLYTLPVASESGKKSRRNSSGTGLAYGKISEDFWFPVGDWKGKVDLDAVRREDGSIDESLLACWFARKSKAIFSYDPLALPKPGAKESLHVVMQIYKLAHLEATDMYTKANTIDPATVRQRVDRCFQQYGAKLLTPICFGVTKLYNKSNGVSSNGVEEQQQWPQGIMQDIQFYAYPTVPESSEAFVERLTNIVAGGVPSAERDTSPEEGHSREMQSDINGTHGTPKRRMVGRLFRSPAKVAPQSRSLPPTDIPPPDHQSTSKETEMIDGRASLFVSALEVDFLESMLTTPPELEGRTANDQSMEMNGSSLPSLLVDPTGDVAVVLGTKQRATSLPAEAQKRSDLVRLPVLTSSAGYMESSEFREVLSLSARREKHYDVDTPPSYRSLVNLLYLYPRALRLSNDLSSPSHRNTLTVRIRLIHTETSIDEATGNTVSRNIIMKSLHPCSSWVSPGLVDSVYTKIREDTGDLRAGVPINDEIKVQLPNIIDGSFTLEFVLFSVDLTPDAGAPFTQIAEATIPLSTRTSSNRDTASGGKVTTVIPNANHRLRLGDFQLQIESRLISSVHIGDPSLALSLRDFPYTKTRVNMVDRGTELFKGYAKSTSQTVDSVVDFNESFPSLLTTASASSVIAHFQVLLHMHLSNLVNVHEEERNGDIAKRARLLFGNVLSLFELLRKAKSVLLSDDQVGNQSLSCFVKSQIDAFDEGFLSPTSKPSSKEVTKDVSESTLDVDSIQVDPSGSHDTPESEVPGGGVVRLQSRKSFRKQHEIRVARIVSALGASGIPFSRVAYGASKTDRMRVEAELQFEGATLDHFFEDDETIATLGTTSTFQVASMTTPREETRPFRRHPDSFAKMNSMKSSTSMDDHSASANSLLRTTGPESSSAKAHETTQPSKSIGDTDFAKRVKSAAQVMLAPCVGPSLSNILARSNSRQESMSPGESSPVATPLFETVKAKKVPAPETLFLCCPGSDIDEDATDYDEEATEIITVFRGPQDGPVFVFSVNIQDSLDLPMTSGRYLYESVILLWLRAWVDHVEASMNKARGHQVGTFVIPEYDPSSQTSSDSIFAFHAHMDFLLPLCLKSMALRYSVEASSVDPPSTRALLDERHVLVLEPFVETLARGLIGQTLASLGTPEDHDKSLLRALSSADVVLEFLVGLVAVLHPDHIDLLLSKYMKTLRDCETEHLGDNLAEIDFVWTEENIHRVRCSRQLRLHAVEAFAVLPAFLALNYPPKYSAGHDQMKRSEKATWKHQYKSGDTEVSPSSDRRPVYQDGIERLPVSGWLSDLLVTEALSVCALSSEAVVAEAMAHIEVSRQSSRPASNNIASSLKKRPGAALKRADLIMFQSLSIQAVTCVYELLLRRQSIDRRYQTDSSCKRIAAMFGGPILDKSIASVRWLARMEATHKVRCTWLLCFVYVLQEAPDAMIQDYVRSCCDPKDVRIHRFIRLLRLCSSSFQGFVDHQSGTALPTKADAGVTAWLMQESFNTICATTNVVVDACVNLISSYPHEQRKMMQGLLDLLLHILTTPQSSVTHLRAVGGALQAMEQFGIALFLEITGTNFQHWVRVILSLMNSISLSVRSIAVDFVVSLFGSVFESYGNVDDVALVFATVLPEVAAREVALYGVSGHIRTLEDVAKALWPLRRAIADIGDANPLDDDRVDPQLSPILVEFGRACQAVIDGVLIEMSLKGRKLAVLGADFSAEKGAASNVFDADEESLFEAASFFLPETGPMQRVRWLLTLRLVHESKEQWVEAAETLMLCASTILDSAPHFKSLWRPSRFTLWSDSRRSAWLETVGEEMGNPDRGNAQVMDMAEDFLEPENVLGSSWKKQKVAGKLPQPCMSNMCEMLIQLTTDAIDLYLKEEGMEELAHGRLETFQKSAMHVLEVQSRSLLSKGWTRGANAAARRRYAEEETALRKLLASVSVAMITITERLLVKEESLPADTAVPRYQKSPRNDIVRGDSPVYVLMRLSGKKPLCFEESTTLPTFLVWGESCICRVKKSIMEKTSVEGGSAATSTIKSANEICQSFAAPFLRALEAECSRDSVKLCTKPEPVIENEDPNMTYLQVFLVDPTGVELGPNKASRLLSKRFFYRQDLGKGQGTSLVEMTVAGAFPFALSRQSTVLMTETKTVPVK